MVPLISSFDFLEAWLFAILPFLDDNLEEVFFDLFDFSFSEERSSLEFSCSISFIAPGTSPIFAIAGCLLMFWNLWINNITLFFIVKFYKRY